MDYKKKEEKSKKVSSKKQKRMSFLEYLQKTQEEGKRKNKIDGLEGTTISTWDRKVVQYDSTNISEKAFRYSKAFEEAKKEEDEQEK
jgi:hypothetical protein